MKFCFEGSPTRGVLMFFVLDIDLAKFWPGWAS